MPALPFLGPTYTSRSRNVNAQRTINLYPEIDPTGVAKGQQAPVAAMYSTPGLKRLSTLPSTGGIRGLYTASDGTLYACQSHGLYRWHETGNWLLLGLLETEEGMVSMVDNGTQLCLVDGPHGYVYVRGTETFAQISDPDFLGSRRVIYVDGYFGFTQPGTQRFYISNLLSTDFDSLNFASAEGFPDLLVTLATNLREIWLFGTTSTEVWYDAGGPDFPFARIQGAVSEFGIAAALSVASVDGRLLLLGQTRNGGRRVYQQQGYQGVPISTHAVETALERMVTVDDAIGFGYQQDGHVFYVLTFPTEEQTWCYDLTTQLWHERQSWWPDGVLRGWRVGCMAHWNQLVLVGDRYDGRLYQLDLATYADDGLPLVRVRTSPHYSTPELADTCYHAFTLDVETGVGLDGGLIPGEDPQAVLTWSDDGGHTWSHDHQVSLGVIGEYQARAIWRRLGQARDRIFRVTISDPIKVALIGVTLEITRGTP